MDSMRKPRPKPVPADLVNVDWREFPAPRYFQIHFAHLESQVSELQRMVEILQAQLARLVPPEDIPEPCPVAKRKVGKR